MFKSFASRLAPALIFQSAILIAVYAISVQTLDRMASDGLVVNYAGRQRMLMERVSKEVLVHARLVEDPLTPAVEIQASVESILNVSKMFDTTLKALTDGGDAPANRAMTAFKQLPAPTDPLVVSQLEIVNNLWEPLQDAIRLTTIDGGGGSIDAKTDAVLAKTAEIIQQVDLSVSAMQTVAEARVSRLLNLQRLALLVSAAATVLATVLIQRSMSAPLKQLANTTEELSTGNLDIQVATSSTIAEISSMFKSVNMLRINLKRTIEVETASKAKSTFLATMSHELRTPLNGILGFAELTQKFNTRLQNKTAPTDPNRKTLTEQASFIQQIQVSAATLLALINQVLDLSKVEAGRMDVLVESVDIPQLLNAVTESCMPLISENGNKISVVIASDTGTAQTDAGKMKQILTNVISNAAKFTKSGQIEVNAYSELRAETEWIVLKVSDTGIGMSEADLTKLFRPFSQVDASITRQFGGTGMGLAIVKEMITLLQGQIDVTSERYKGTTFTMQIPRQYKAVAEGSTAGSAMDLRARVA